MRVAERERPGLVLEPLTPAGGGALEAGVRVLGEQRDERERVDQAQPAEFAGRRIGVQ